MIMVKTKNLSVGYDKKTVVKNVEIEAMKGKMICLLGPNGSGKTTILRTLSGLLTSVDGDIEIKGNSIKKVINTNLSKVLSVVLTERPNSGLMNVFDLVSMGRYPHTGFLGKLTDCDIEITKNSLELVNALDLAERYFIELSDGEKQKVLLARALAQEPEIMILDEPTIHLDVNHKMEVISILKKLCQEKNITVILSLHEIDLAKKSCDYVLLIKDGEILEAGFPEDVIRDDSIQKLYNIKSAKYNDLLGTIEFSSYIKKEIFLVGGNGSSAKVLRVFNKKGYYITTGVLHENDIDYHVAESFGGKIIKETPYEEISMKSYNEAVKHVNSSKFVIDSGVEFRKGNIRNKDLILEALKNNIKVLSLRNKEASEKIYQNNEKGILYFKCVNELLESINK